MIKIIRHYYVAESVYNWVRGLADWSNVAPGTYDLFVSLLTRSAWRYKFSCDENSNSLSPAYPLSSKWLRKIKANPSEISALLECDNTYYIATNNRPGKCRYYWVKSDIIMDFALQLFTRGKHCINLYSGSVARKNRPLPTDVQRPSLYDKHRNLKTSSLVANAINTISNKKITINYAAFCAYTQRLNDAFAKRCPMRIDNPTLKGRLVKNTRMANHLMAHFFKFRSPDCSNMDYISYTPCYSAVYTGRITERHIGLQGCSRQARRKLLIGIDYANFDLQSAQLSCLHYLLPPGDIKDDLAKKISRIYSEAASFGFPKKLVKPFLYAYIFNAGRLYWRITSVQKLKQYAQKNKLMTNYMDFVAGLSPVRIATLALLAQIKEKCNHGSWINHAGVTLTAEKLQKRAEQKLNKYLRNNITTFCFPREKFLRHAKDKILLAFCIQGIETYIIHTLTLAGSSDTYTVISNQHDGIIITGDKNAVNVQMQKINKAINANFVLAEKPI